jgi:hypothetical protein
MNLQYVDLYTCVESGIRYYFILSEVHHDCCQSLQANSGKTDTMKINSKGF